MGTGIFQGMSQAGIMATTTLGGAIIGGAIDLISGGDGTKGLMIGAGIGLASNFASAFNWKGAVNVLGKAAPRILEGANQYAQFASYGDGDEDWKPLYKKDMEDAMKAINMPFDDNFLGDVLENIFEKYVNEDQPGEILGFNFRKATPKDKSTAGGIRNTVPDFLADSYTVIQQGYGGFRYLNEGAVWYEVKAKSGGLYLSGSTGQLEGHIDNLNAEWGALATRWAKYNFKPRLVVATTADVKDINGIKAYGWKKGVKITHVKAYYKYSKQGVKFSFR